DLFHFPGVTHDTVMLMVFPIILKGQALRWKKRLPAGMINTSDLLEKVSSRNIERYIDLLYKCPQHDLNCQQKVHIFYTGLDISTRRMLDSRGFITLMKQTQALISIQVMLDHSHNWYDVTTTNEKINDRPDNVDTIQESFKEAHLTKECPLKKRTRQLSSEKAYQVTQTVLTSKSEKRMTMGKENMKEPVPRNLPPTPFLGHLKEKMGSPSRARKTVCMIGNPEEVHIMKAQKNEGDTDVGWDIIVKDSERLRQFLTPTIYTL
ncbi:hypothetical protein Tco_1432351, partial [Tanacetum coccineum]